MSKKIVHIVYESGNGYGPSFNAFYKKANAKKYFEQLVNEYSEFTDLASKEQQKVLDNQELQCQDDGVIRIIPVAVD